MAIIAQSSASFEIDHWFLVMATHWFLTDGFGQLRRILSGFVFTVTVIVVHEHWLDSALWSLQ